MSINVFYSYSHKDERLQKKLETHLALLQQEGRITGWHGRNISAGKNWEQEIDTYLNTAQIILLLISADYLASRYCSSIEMKKALERHNAGQACVIPIILRPLDWKAAPFSHIQPLPTDGLPVTDRKWHNQDEAFTNIAQGIRKVIEMRAAMAYQHLVHEPIQAVLCNHAFVDHIRLFGVEDLIHHIGNLLSTLNGNWIISLSGEGGVGKTALAYEVVSRYAAEAGFTRVAWVSAKSIHLSLDGILVRTNSAKFRWTNLIKSMADQLGIRLDSAEWMKDFQRGIRELPQSEKCLLVIDNLETVEDVDEAIHYLGGDQIIKPHKILVTTRTALLGKVQSIVEKQVTGLELPDALAFIRSIGNKDIEEAEDNDLKPIVDATEGNPLLIKLFVRRFLTSHLPLHVILSELQTVHEQFGKNIVDYLYAESLSLLKEQCGSDIAHSIMNAFCPLSAGDTVDYDDLLKYSGLKDQESFRSALKVSCDLALIRSSKLNSKYSIHSLLWKFICD